MKTAKKALGPYETWKKKIQKEKKRIKRKKFLLKARFFLLVILPVVVLVLAVKTARVWVHLKLKSIAPPLEKPKIRPITLEPVEKEFITPQKAGDEE